MRPDSDFLCKDCRCEFYTYMVTNPIWAAAGLKPHEFCCQSCLSVRLGRPLIHADYTLCMLNIMGADGFDTEENYRAVYSADGLDYDKTKAEYEERCFQLGIESRWKVSAR